MLRLATSARATVRLAAARTSTLQRTPALLSRSTRCLSSAAAGSAPTSNSDSASPNSAPAPVSSKEATPSADAATHSSQSSSTSEPAPLSSSQPPPPPPGSDLEPSRLMTWVTRIVAAGVGVYAAVQLVVFVSAKSRAKDEAQAASSANRRAGLSNNGSAPSDPSIRIPPLDYRTHTMSEIFSSVLHPLTNFERLADEFVDRKAASVAEVAGLAAKRRKEPVSAADAKRVEVEATKVAADERTLFAPRLVYLRELYRARSLELMQRSQFNGERMVEAGKSGNAEEAARIRAEVKAEHLAFTALAQSNQHLARIVDKYSLTGSPTGMRMMMQEGVPETAEQQHQSKANAKK